MADTLQPGLKSWDTKQGMPDGIMDGIAGNTFIYATITISNPYPATYTQD